MYMGDINRNLNEKFARLDEDLIRLATDISKLNSYAEEDRENIRLLQEDRDCILHRLERMENELEATEIEKRKNNLKFLGVEELEREDDETSVRYVVDILNDSSSNKTWESADVERTFRVGQNKRNSNYPRPLIVVFHRWADKMKVLRDTGIRNDLRKKNIKVTSDLTPKQRNEIEYYRRQGKRAYYRNGRLQVDDRPPLSNQHHHDQWTRGHGQRHERGYRWKPQSRNTPEGRDRYSYDGQELREEELPQNRPWHIAINSGERDQQNYRSNSHGEHRHTRREQDWQQNRNMKHAVRNHHTATQPGRGWTRREEQARNYRGHDGNRSSSPVEWVSLYQAEWGPLFPDDQHSDDTAEHTTSKRGGAIPVCDRTGAGEQSTDGREPRQIHDVPGHRLYSDVVSSQRTRYPVSVKSPASGSQEVASRDVNMEDCAFVPSSPSDLQDAAGDCGPTGAAINTQPQGSEEDNRGLAKSDVIPNTSRDSTDAICSPEHVPSSAQQDVHPRETDGSSEAAPLDQALGHGVEEGHDPHADRAHGGLDASPADSEHPPPLDPVSGDVTAITPGTPGTGPVLASTGSEPAATDDNNADPQTDTDLSIRDGEGESPPPPGKQSAIREPHVQTDQRSRSLRSAATRKPRALSQSNITDTFKRRTNCDSKGSNKPQTIRHKNK